MTGPLRAFTLLEQVQRPGALMGFVSARSANAGLEANGYYHVTPPYGTALGPRVVPGTRPR
jgi:hypothetical protein